MEEIKNITEPQMETQNETSENKEKENLYVRRDISEILGAAWTLLSTNYKRICKTMAIPVLLMAIIMALFGSYISAMIPTLNENIRTGAELSTLPFVLLTVGTILIIASSFYFYGACFKLLNGRSVKYNIWRYLKAGLTITALTLVFLIVFFGLLFVATAKESALSTILAFVVMIFYILAILPLTYTSMKYMIETDAKITVLFKSYGKGLRHYWLIFGTIALASILIYVISLILQMPMAIAILAQFFSSMGVAMGDSSELPSSFGTLVLATTFVSAIIHGAVLIYMAFVQYYIYGSIEVRNKANASPSTDSAL